MVIIQKRQVCDNNDVTVCNELCKSVYGFSMEMELLQAKDRGVATMIDRDGAIAGYAAGIGIFGHAVAKSNEGLKALIANAPAILGSGFFVPARNHEVIKWLLEKDIQIGWPPSISQKYKNFSNTVLIMINDSLYFLVSNRFSVATIASNSKYK